MRNYLIIEALIEIQLNALRRVTERSNAEEEGCESLRIRLNSVHLHEIADLLKAIENEEVEEGGGERRRGRRGKCTSILVKSFFLEAIAIARLYVSIEGMNLAFLISRMRCSTSWIDSVYERERDKSVDIENGEKNIKEKMRRKNGKEEAEGEGRRNTWE